MPTTSTRRQLASRANGALSKGPTSPEGKRKSSANSLRHGILAQTVVLEGESRSRFEALLDALTADHQPTTETETALVETLAVDRWRQMRCWSHQKASLDLAIAQQPRELGPAPVRAAAAFRDLADQGRTLDALLSYETAFDRQFAQALKDLEI
jgi:hypothetical protein